MKIGYAGTGIYWVCKSLTWMPVSDVCANESYWLVPGTVTAEDYD